MGKKSKRKQSNKGGSAREKEGTAGDALEPPGLEDMSPLTELLDTLRGRAGDDTSPGLLAVLARQFAKNVLGDDADLATPYAHFVASNFDAFAQSLLDGGREGKEKVRATLAVQWSELSEAEKAKFTSPPAFAFPDGSDASSAVADFFAGKIFAHDILKTSSFEQALATPYAHFVASKFRDFTPLRGREEEVRTTLAKQWSELSEAEKAAFTSPPSFPASAGVDTAEDSQEGHGHDDASTSTSRRPPSVQPPSPAQDSRPASSSAAPNPEAAADGIDDATGTGYYGKQLLLFAHRTIAATGDKVFSWVQSEYDGDLQRLRADADRGDSMAQLGMAYGALGACVRDSNSGYEGAEQALTWLDKACAGAECHRSLATLSFFMIQVSLHHTNFLGKSEEGKLLLQSLKDLIEVLDGGTGSAEVQHLVGLIECARAKPSAREDILEAARYIRAAAHLGLRDAEFELGEMFRKGAICDVKMRLARLYLKRAKKQGHPEAIQRMHELCSCVLCGAERAPLKCSTCLETRYCDSKCSAEHWRGGGGVSEVCEALLPHRDTCPRTYEDPAYDYE